MFDFNLARYSSPTYVHSINRAKYQLLVNFSVRPLWRHFFEPNDNLVTTILEPTYVTPNLWPLWFQETSIMNLYSRRIRIFHFWWRCSWHVRICRRISRCLFPWCRAAGCPWTRGQGHRTGRAFSLRLRGFKARLIRSTYNWWTVNQTKYEGAAFVVLRSNSYLTDDVTLPERWLLKF